MREVRHAQISDRRILHRRRFARPAQGQGYARRQAITTAIESLGGRLECEYFALGEHDVYLIADLPDTVSAAALGIATSATGLVRTRTIALMTAEEVDRALEKTVNYRPPGR